jgi:hypothetical protein
MTLQFRRHFNSDDPSIQKTLQFTGAVVVEASARLGSWRNNDKARSWRNHDKARRWRNNDKALAILFRAKRTI